MNTVAYLTPEQCRAARVLLKWSQEELAYQANMSVLTIRHFEKEKTVPLRVTLAMISGALQSAGVEFTNGDAPGIRLCRS